MKKQPLEIVLGRTMMTAYFPHKTIAFLLLSTTLICAADNTNNTAETVITDTNTILAVHNIPDNDPIFSRPCTPTLPEDDSPVDAANEIEKQLYSLNPEDKALLNQENMIIGQNLQSLILPVQSFYDAASDVRGRKTFKGMRFFNVEEIFARLDFSVESNQFHVDIHDSATGPRTSLVSRKTATYRLHDDDGAATIAVAYMLAVQNLLLDMSWFKDWNVKPNVETTATAEPTVETPAAATTTRQDMIEKLKEATFPVKWHLFRNVATVALTYRVGYLQRIIEGNCEKLEELKNTRDSLQDMGVSEETLDMMQSQWNNNNLLYEKMIEEIQTMQSGIFTKYQAADQSPSYQEFADSVGQWLQKTLKTCVYITNIEHTTMKTFSPVSMSVVAVDDAINKLFYYYPFDLNLTEAQFSRFQSEEGGFLINFEPNKYPFTAIPGVVTPNTQAQQAPTPTTPSFGTSPVGSENTDLTASLQSLSADAEDHHFHNESSADNTDEDADYNDDDSYTAGGDDNQDDDDSYTAGGDDNQDDDGSWDDSDSETSDNETKNENYDSDV